MTPRAPMVARLLGPFQLEVGGRVIERWERPSARRLLQFLLLDAGRPVARAELVEALFPALDADRGAAALAKAISMARAAIGRDRIDSTRSYVRLAAPAETDLEATLAALRNALDSAGPEALRTALAIPGEPVPEERYADWPEPARTALADLRRRCRFQLAATTARLRSGADAAVVWEEALTADPTSEEAAIAAIEAHAAVGARGLAARVYERCRVALAEEIGVEPSAELISAYRRAVFDDPSAASESAACLQLGRARLQAGDGAGADAAFGRALELASDVDARVAAWAALASVPYQHGDMAAVIDVCRMALDTISGAAGRNRALLSAELGWAEVRSGRPEQGRPHLDRAAEMLRVDPGMDPDLPARTLDRLALARSDCGDHVGGLRAMEEAFRAAPPARPHLGAVLRMHRGRLLGRVGRAEEGLGDVLAAKRVFTARQDAYSTSVAHWLAAELLDQLGLLERALAERRAEIVLLEKIENPRNLAGALIHVSDLLRRLGRVRDAGAAAARALDAALLSGDPRLVAWARAQTPPASGKVSGKARA